MRRVSFDILSVDLDLYVLIQGRCNGANKQANKRSYLAVQGGQRPALGHRTLSRLHSYNKRPSI